MGCAFGKESSPPLSGAGLEGRELRREAVSGKKVEVEVGQAVAGGDGVGKLEREEEGGSRRPQGERRRAKPNPRLSNLPKGVHGEQVAAGWPSWLSAVAGEAIKGWTPRRADSFQKIDKAIPSLSLSHYF